MGEFCLVELNTSNTCVVIESYDCVANMCIKIIWRDLPANKYSGGNQHLQQCKTRNISFKCCSKHKSRDSFGFCSSWGFQNTPNMLKLIEFWLRYLRSKTNDWILKNSSKLIEIDENHMKTKLFVTKLILAIFGDINVNENHFSEANEMFWMLHWLLLRQNV